jgi:Cu/Ag efflux protein CusF
MYERVLTAAAVGLTLLGLAGSASAEKLIGSVAAVDAAAKTVSVQETSASQPTLFSVDAKTKVFEGRKEIALSDLKQGRNVKVTYEKKDGADVASRIEAEVANPADKTTDLPNYKSGQK